MADQIPKLMSGQLDAAQERFAAIRHSHDGDSGASQPSGAWPGSS